MQEKVFERIFLKTMIAKSQEKSCLEFFENFLFRIVTHITFQLAPNIVLNSVPLMRRSMRDVHKLICLLLMKKGREFAIRINSITFIYKYIHIIKSTAPVIFIYLNGLS